MHQRFVHPGPLVLGTAPFKYPAPTTDRDRTVSRRSEPSSRTALIGEQPNPYCNGSNYLLNAVEYHRDSEVNVALTDLILILGKEQDIEADGTYQTEKMEAFLVPAGTVVEVYATTLHYAPCNVNENKFCTAVILPKGTNEDAPAPQSNTAEDKLLFAKNKWLIAHKDAKIQGAFEGLIGENLSVK